MKKEVKETKKSELEILNEKIQKQREEAKAKLAKLKEQQKELRAQANALKEEEKQRKAEEKKQQAAEKAAKLKEALANGDLKPKINMTQMVQDMMAEGLDVDEMMTKSGFTRKQILDRRWQIEKKLGIR